MKTRVVFKNGNYVDIEGESMKDFISRVNDLESNTIIYVNLDPDGNIVKESYADHVGNMVPVTVAINTEAITHIFHVN